jgi:hypothetical protein
MKYQISIEFLYQYFDNMVFRDENCSSEKLYEEMANIVKNSFLNMKATITIN